MGAIDLPTLTQGRRAFDALASKLAAIPDDAIARPHTDPFAAAVTALLVSDWLAQPAIVRSRGAVGLETSDIVDLGRMARAIIMFVRTLGGDYLPETRRISEELVQRGHAVCQSAIASLEKALPPTPETTLWLEAVRRATSAVDLVYDLRTLSELHTLHASELPADIAKLPSILRAAADALEAALRADESAEQASARVSLRRLWTLFVPAYDRAAAASRELTRRAGAGRSFPPLALIAAHQRAKRGVEPPREGEAAEIRRSQPPALAATDTGSRRAARATLELEVAITSESNFYVGFTENLSAAGVFVATYAASAIGTRLQIALTMANGETVNVPGTVKWLRGASADAWPGMGVEFEKLSAEDEAKIRAFVATREPLFFEA